MLKKYSLLALQKAINTALNLDETMPSKLSQLEGKAVEMRISPLQVNFFLLFKDKTLCLVDSYESEPDAIIQSSPLGLIRLSLLPASKARSLFNDSIRISGDVALGQDIKKLFDELDIDWEGHLAHFTGDVVAHQIGCMIRSGLSFGKQWNESMRQNITEYVQEELRLSPTQDEIEDFFHDVDALSLDTERLYAHVEKLMRDYEAH